MHAISELQKQDCFLRAGKLRVKVDPGTVFPLLGHSPVGSEHSRQGPVLIIEATDSQRMETNELGPASFQRNRRRGTDSSETRWPQECKFCPGDQT